MKRRWAIGGAAVAGAGVVSLLTALAIMFPSRDGLPPAATVADDGRHASVASTVVRLLDHLETARIEAPDLDEARAQLDGYPYFRSAPYLSTSRRALRHAGNLAVGDVLLEHDRAEVRHSSSEYEAMYSLYVPGGARMQVEVDLPRDPVLELHTVLVPLGRAPCDGALTVSVDGRELLREELSAAAHVADFRWREHALPMGDGGSSATIELASETASGCDGHAQMFVGNPRIVGSAGAGDPPLNVVYLNIDALLPWGLGAYGGGRGASPAIDALAAGGTRFERVYANGNFSKSSHYSAIFSRLPSAIGLKPYRNGVARYERENLAALRWPSLASVLRARGYETHLFASNFFLSDFLSLGVDTGFEHYVDNSEDRVDTIEIFNSAIEWLEDHGSRPFFLFVNPQNTHYRYRPPRESLWQVGLSLGDLASNPQLPLYLGEIAHVDELVGALVSALDRLGLRERTLIVLHSDHGDVWTEEHDIQLTRRDPYVPHRAKMVGGLMYHHGFTTFEEEIRVPLILNLPGVVPTGTVPGTVSLVDVAPTILGLLGVEAPRSFQGRDALAPGGAGLPVLVQGKTMESVIEGDLKYSVRPPDLQEIQRRGWPEPRKVPEELYDLVADPLERDNLVADPARAEALAHMRELYRSLRPEVGPLYYVQLGGAEGERLSGTIDVGAEVVTLASFGLGAEDVLERTPGGIRFSVAMRGDATALLALSTPTTARSLRATVDLDGRPLPAAQLRFGPHGLALLESGSTALAPAALPHLAALPGERPPSDGQPAHLWIWSAGIDDGGPQGYVASDLDEEVMDALRGWGYAK